MTLNDTDNSYFELFLLCTCVSVNVCHIDNPNKFAPIFVQKTIEGIQLTMLFNSHISCYHRNRKLSKDNVNKECLIQPKFVACE